MGNLWFALGHKLGQPGFRLDDIDPNSKPCRSVEEFYRHAVNPMLDDPLYAAIANRIAEMTAEDWEDIADLMSWAD